MNLEPTRSEKQSILDSIDVAGVSIVISREFCESDELTLQDIKQAVFTEHVNGLRYSDAGAFHDAVLERVTELVDKRVIQKAENSDGEIVYRSMG